MGGHSHNPTADTQNQGNSLGDRSCVRQSKLYRMYESGNDVKSILGTAHLCWDSNQKQGAYQGQQVYDHTMDDPLNINKAFTNTNNYSRHDSNEGRRSDGRGGNSGGVGNFLTGYTDGTKTDYRRGPVSGKEHEAPKGRNTNYAPPRDRDYEEAPQQNHRRVARNSFSNDENKYRDRNSAPFARDDDSSYPTKAQRGGDNYDQRDPRDDRYRSMKGDVDSSLSSYQSKKNQYAEPPMPQERSAVRVFKQDKPTRPW